MLDKYVQSEMTRSWINDGIFSSIIPAYINYLESRQPTISTYVRCVAHFSYWAKKKKIKLSHTDKRDISQFLYNHLPDCKCPMPCRRTLFDTRATLNYLFVVLSLEGKVSIGLTSTPLDVELKYFDHYLDEVCGLATTTRISRVQRIRNFLFHFFHHRPIDIGHLSPRNILKYIIKCSEKLKPATIERFCSSLRSYLRYRAHKGDSTEALTAAVPTAAHWRLASIPKSLNADEIKRILKSFDRSKAAGKRDYAIARCLIDLGLRASEVAFIQIDDLNWRKCTLQIRSSKGKRRDLLLLPASTCEAIVDYLRFGSPENLSRALFVRHRAPLDKPIGLDIVRCSMRMAYRRCGLNPTMGTHILRHSAACRMINSGASLKEIADVLRHRSIDTTQIYTKVDITRLSQVATPWLGGLS